MTAEGGDAAPGKTAEGGDAVPGMTGEGGDPARPEDAEHTEAAARPEHAEAAGRREHQAPVTGEPSLSPRSLAFFGGTFDPPHLGHLIVARDVAEALDLEAVFFLPARVPPHKQDEDVSAGEVRLEMLKAAVQDDEVLGVSDLELRRDPPSYSVDTLRELKERIPTTDLHFVIGTDQLAELDRWKEPEEVARLARLVVVTRPGGDRPGPGEDGARGGRPAAPPDVTCPLDVPFELVPVTRIELSSTRIRARVREGRSIRYLVPDPVRRIIEREGLYK